MKQLHKLGLAAAITLTLSMAFAQTPPANQSATPPKAETGKESSLDLSALPSIMEVFQQAKNNAIMVDWEKQLKLDSKDYTNLDLPSRAFAAGSALSTIAFLVLDSSKSNPPSKAVLEEAYKAITSLKPSATITEELQRLRDRIEKGGMKNSELRQAVSDLVGSFIPLIVEEEPKLRDAGTLVMVVGYFKAMAIGTETVAAMSQPSQGQLNMFKWKGLAGNFANYFINEAEDDFKKNPQVRNLVVALKKIQPLLDKPKGQPLSKDEVALIAKTLQPLFK